MISGLKPLLRMDFGSFQNRRPLNVLSKRELFHSSPSQPHVASKVDSGSVCNDSSWTARESDHASGETASPDENRTEMQYLALPGESVLSILSILKCEPLV